MVLDPGLVVTATYFRLRGCGFESYLVLYVLYKFRCYFSCPTTKLLQSIQGEACHGCLNHDIVVGLYSKLLKRLSFYTYQAYGKKFLTLGGIKPGTSRSLGDFINCSTKALTF